MADGKQLSRPQLVSASLAMLTVALLANVLAPRQLAAGTYAASDISKIIPKHFGVWSYVPSIGLVKPSRADDPNLDPKLRAWGMYSQVVGRGYRDENGHVVMLMVAYGPIQDTQLMAHRPELCYTAAGFRISNKSEASVAYRDDAPPLSLTRLTAQRESRLEPVSYWMRVGGAMSHGVFDRQIIRLKYGLHGVIPDGALIRVSTVGLAPTESFKLQDQFIRDLLAAVAPTDRPFFVGAI